MDEEQVRLMMKMAAKITDLEKRVESLEQDVHKLAAGDTVKTEPSRQPGLSTIDIVFKDGNKSEFDRKVLIGSIYKILRKLCDENDIFSLRITIED